MQPLKLLTNVQKARLLYNLLIQEIPDFLSFLKELTDTVLEDREQITAEWKDPIFGVEFWFELAEEVRRVMAEYPKDLYKSAHVFAEQLFEGYKAIFSAYALTQYVALGRHTDAKFKTAVELLFTY